MMAQWNWAKQKNAIETGPILMFSWLTLRVVFIKPSFPADRRRFPLLVQTLHEFAVFWRRSGRVRQRGAVRKVSRGIAKPAQGRCIKVPAEAEAVRKRSGRKVRNFLQLIAGQKGPGAWAGAGAVFQSRRVSWSFRAVLRRKRQAVRVHLPGSSRTWRQQRLGAARVRTGGREGLFSRVHVKWVGFTRSETKTHETGLCVCARARVFVFPTVWNNPPKLQSPAVSVLLINHLIPVSCYYGADQTGGSNNVTARRG